MITNYRREVFEIFEEFKKADGRNERLDVLKKYSDNWAFRDILRGSFDESLVFTIPEGRPPFTPNQPQSVPSSLNKLHKDFGWFVQGGAGDRLPDFKRENKFIGLLESIHPEDAELVLKMVAKKAPCRYITKKLVQEAFPDLIVE